MSKIGTKTESELVKIVKTQQNKICAETFQNLFHGVTSDHVSLNHWTHRVLTGTSSVESSIIETGSSVFEARSGGDGGQNEERNRLAGEEPPFTSIRDSRWEHDQWSEPIELRSPIITVDQWSEIEAEAVVTA